MALPPLAISLIVGGAAMGLQYLLQPRVKQQPTDKGKMDDIRITGSEYGTFWPRGKGKFRVGGNVLFSDGITHTIQETPSGGGKGVPQAPATRTHVYTSSIGVGICRGPINNIYRVWADADLILGNGDISTGSFEAEDETLAGGASVDTDAGASGGEFVTGLGSGGKVTFDTSGVPAPAYPVIRDPDEVAISYTRCEFFYKCSSDLEAKIAVDGNPAVTFSFPSTAGQWTAKTLHLDGHADSIEFANPSAAAPDLDYLGIEKYWFIDTANNPTTFKNPTYRVTGKINEDISYPTDPDDPSAYYNAVISADGNGKIALTVPFATTRYYKGTLTQTQDSAITAWLDARYGAGEGVLRTPAHRGMAYAMYENRVLKQARVENYTFEVDAGDNTVNDVLEMLFADVNFTGSDYDLTDTTGLEFVGFLEHAPASRRQWIEHLERYFFFRIAEIDGKIYTVADSTTSIATIDSDWLRAHADGSDAPGYDGEIAFKDETTIPREIRVSVMNPDLEYKNETVTAPLFGSMISEEIAEFAFPLVDTAVTARLVAEKLVLKANSELRAIEFTATPEMAKYAVGDVITVPFEGENIRLRIEKKQMALPHGMVKVQGVELAQFTPTYYQDDFTEQAQVRPQQLAAFQFPRNSVVVPIISEPVQARDRGKLGLYLAACGRGRGAAENIAVYREFDTDNFVLQYVADAPAVVGLCAGTLATHGTPASEDTINTLDIWFFDAVDLESVTAPDIARYPTLNLLRVGDEWLQFRTATAQTLEENSPYRAKWRVSNLMRGRFGTTSAIGTHAADEYATLFTSAVKFFELDKSDIGESIVFKAVTNGQAEENGLTSTVTFSPPSEFALSNWTETTTFDADATTLDEVADVLATVINKTNLDNTV